MFDESRRVMPASMQPVYVFTIPEKLRYSNSAMPSTIGIVELSAKQLNMVKERCKGKFERLSDEQVKESIVELDGQPVGARRELVDALWDNALQKMIYHLTAAYQKVNHPDDEDILGFLDTSSVKVG